MKVCPSCGLLYLDVSTILPYSCKACEGTYDDSGDGMNIVSLRDINEDELKQLRRLMAWD